VSSTAASRWGSAAHDVLMAAIGLPFRRVDSTALMSGAAICGNSAGAGLDRLFHVNVLVLADLTAGRYPPASGTGGAQGCPKGREAHSGTIAGSCGKYFDGWVYTAWIVSDAP